MSNGVWQHGGDQGDVLAHLPVIRALGGGRLVLHPIPVTGNRMTPERVENMRPLLEQQHYITAVEWREKPTEGFDLNNWRVNYNRHLSLTDMACDWLKVPRPEREQPWLFIEPKRVAPVVFARSERYHNDRFPWRRVYDLYRRDAVFVGTAEEHQDFTNDYGPISYHVTEDMGALAAVIAGADLFVGNQSSPFNIAEGLKVPTLLEIYVRCNNCHWERRGNLHGFDESVELPDPATLHARRLASVAARAAGHTLVSDDRVRVLARLVDSVKHLPGDLAELGVYQGGTAKVMAGVDPAKPLHLFDTFTGIPEDDQERGGHRAGEFAAAEQEVRAFMAGTRAVFHVGRFPDTTAGLADSRFSLVHLDADTYQSTRAGIEWFWPRLVAGGVLVLDDLDWANCPGVRRAVEELLPGVEVRTEVPQQGYLIKA